MDRYHYDEESDSLLIHLKEGEEESFEEVVPGINSEHRKETEKLRNIVGLGESEAIALCLQEKAKLLLIDNLEPRKIAQTKGIRCRSTPGILLDAFKNGIIRFEDYEAAIKELSKYAWLSGDIVAYFLGIGYKIKNKGEIK